MSVFAVTGSASGIGAATAELLRSGGHRVVGVDLRDADVIADLGTESGRIQAIAGVLAACGHRLDGLVTAAGIGASSTEQGGRLVRINYFGTVALVDGLRPALAAAETSAVVCVSSNSSTCQPDWPEALALACIDGDEERAVSLAEEQLSLLAYAPAKAAIAWWVRERAAEWAGDGIRMNAIAPGLIETPMTDAQRTDPLIGQFIDAFPVPRGTPGRPGEVAAVIDFLLSPAASLLYGSVIFADGGTDALTRTRDWPAVWRTR
ncbi:SDR family oxidoreductase [Jatrophihabitans sp.]|uniref:SDR family oxidoreductase n=1 Tax=Jatrophihabitans sp. TaxID=1932789 RepID=UPI0030C72686|nr:NAD-dependent epimerase/dehydratase [Jatrophihabitans sp.]